MLKNLKKYKILLASKSPRRRELLQQMRIPFNVVTISGIDESYPDSLPPIEVAQFISEKKADVYQKHIKDNEMVITADTIVVCGDEIFGKPKDGIEAVEMLMKLSGRTHQVVTGVTITTTTRRTSFSVMTDVTFSEISAEEADYYVENFLPFDKAGAYGIQEWIGCVAVESINGSFYNVMGLPVNRLYQELKLF